MKDISELPEEQLIKSYTYRFYKDAHGKCSKCGGHTRLLDSCCGYPVEFGPYAFSMEDLWEQIETDLEAAAMPDYDAQAKDDEIDFGGEK